MASAGRHQAGTAAVEMNLISKESLAEAIRTRIIDVVAPLVPVVSPVCTGSSKLTRTCDCAARLYTSWGSMVVSKVTKRVPSVRSP